MMCLAPVLLAGYLWTVQTAAHRTASFDAPMFEVQTCETGIGIAAKGATSGLVGIDLQYGLQHAWGPWSVTVQPKAGLSHAMQAVYELPSQTQFGVGASVLVGYEAWRIGVTYWHLSNAGMEQPNIGIDLFGLQTGWAF